MEQYPQGSTSWEREVTRLREEDVSMIDNLPKVYARKSARTVAPTSSTDILPNDAKGDGIYLNGFLYVVIDNSGSLKWQRVALSDF